MEFKQAIKPFAIKNSNEATHYSLSGGKYFIDTTKKDKFYELYTKAFEDNMHLDIVEKPLPLKPILVDFDFKSNKGAQHIYTNDDIKSIVAALIQIFYQYFEKKKYSIYVYEKPPRYDDKSGKYKDGLHIIVPELVCSPQIQMCIRNKFIETSSSILTNLDVSNAIQDIYDISVIKSNGWLMYGSKKPDEPSPWKVTKVFEVDDVEVEEKMLDYYNKSLIKTLSIREAVEVHGEATATQLAIKDVQAKKKCSSIRDSVASMKSTYNKNNNIDFAKLEEVVMNLAPWRSESYDNWSIIIWAIKNIAEDNDYIDKGLELCQRFSQQTTKNNYDEEAVDKLYESGHKSDLGFGTLMMFLKEDNEEVFKKVKNSQVKLIETILASRSDLDADIAKVIYAMFKDDFVACPVSNNNITWFRFFNHRWYEMSKETQLKMLITNEVFHEYGKVIAQLQSRIEVTEDEDTKKQYENIVEALTKIQIKFRKNNFKKTLVDECVEWFFQTKEDFYERLDTNTHLIGFTNGIYDLKNRTFRDGLPTDYVTKSVGYDFVRIVDATIRIELNKMFQSVMPTQEMKDYLLDTLGYSVHGDKKLEQLFFWIGSGANGKGLVSSLCDVTFGQYYYAPHVSIYTSKKGTTGSSTSEIALIKGKRLLISSEAESDEKFQIGFLKLLSSGRDKIQARALYKDSIEFIPQGTVVIQMNNLPSLSDYDGGMQRRLRIIKFPYKFVEDPNPDIPFQKKIDTDLKNKICNDVRYRQQFMLMLIERFHDLEDRGFKLDPPQEVLQETSDYMGENNIVGKFISETLEITGNDDDIIQLNNLFNMFKTYDEHTKKEKNWFNQQMKNNGFTAKKWNRRQPPENTNKYFFHGVRIKELEMYGDFDDCDPY